MFTQQQDPAAGPLRPQAAIQEQCLLGLRHAEEGDAVVQQQGCRRPQAAMQDRRLYLQVTTQPPCIRVHAAGQQSTCAESRHCRPAGTCCQWSRHLLQSCRVLPLSTIAVADSPGLPALQTRALLYMTALSNSLLEAVATAEDAITQVIALHYSAGPSAEHAGPAAKRAGAAMGFASSQAPPADQSGGGGLVLVCSTVSKFCGKARC